MLILEVRISLKPPPCVLLSLNLSTEGSLVITRAYPALYLGGTPVKRPVLAPPSCLLLENRLYMSKERKTEGKNNLHFQKERKIKNKQKNKTRKM